MTGYHINDSHLYDDELSKGAESGSDLSPRYDSCQGYALSFVRLLHRRIRPFGTFGRLRRCIRSTKLRGVTCEVAKTLPSDARSA